MKRFKKILVLVIVIISIVALTLSFASLMKGNGSKTKLLDEVKSVLKNDYLAANIVFGKPTTDEANVKIGTTKYDIVIDEGLSGIADLENLITNTYTGDALDTYLLDLDKYNQYIEVQDNLYVNVNSLCDVSDFDDKVTIIKSSSKEITIKNNNKEVKLIKDNNKYKLQKSVYLCKEK